MTAPEVHGQVAPGFERVAEVFAENLRSRGELGGACALARGGERLVDVWGGLRDPRDGSPWQRDTLALVFSTGKGLAALALLMAWARGGCELDAPVASLWPEFGQAGKQRVTLAELLSHSAGLAAPRARITLELLRQPPRLDALLAAETPAWEPGRRWGYHALSFGPLVDAVLARSDPQGRRCGRFVTEELTTRLGLELHIGLPADIPGERVAGLDLRPLQLARDLACWPPALLAASLWPGSLSWRAAHNPRLPALGELASPGLRGLPFASGNAYATARSLARLYALMASGGRELGFEQRHTGRIERRPEPPAGGARDLVLKTGRRWGLGLLRPGGSARFGSSPRAYGMHGAGGSFAFADPDSGCGYAYVSNRFRGRLFDDPRELALRTACFEALGRRGGAQSG